VGASVAAIVVAALWLAAYVNAFNFMDGINGISALTAVLAGGVYAVLGVLHGRPSLVGAGAVVAAAATTFLPWNVIRPRIFMGDVGSYGLGGVIGGLAAYAALCGVPIEAAAAPLAVYLADTGWTLARRIATGQPWHHAHRTHVYQRLTDLGWSHLRVALTVVALGAAVSLVCLLGTRGPTLARSSLDALAVALLIGYLMAPRWLTLVHRRSVDRETSYV
jgi:UDP-N-acetylmuramyl pentapeptide phosphotransferase/UDP-N-acetylglucosamine-1-phosphate transferase